ncbi:hypothetical protein [Deinococcus sp. QL22]|uniref:hypothetical protein n=1 Tax=Deinococcus sp. QL22 TaxID=2939437 RepID=UPI00201779DC|nr:hypothetical protein [Deinococcus sp. QL22]UQN05495.1 hypothetical protein M1R55_11475 [Deinococcus sp. QL22]
MSAAVIKFPALERPPTKRREAGTFTMTDSAVVTYQKRHGSAPSRTLTALAERANFTQKPPMSIAELMVETELGQRAIEKALVTLSAQGFCASVGKLWKYTNPNQDANGNANGNANSRSHERSHGRSEKQGKNIVLDGEKRRLKEVEGSRRKGSVVPTPKKGAEVDGTAQNTAELEATPEVPDGTASGEAHNDLHSLTDEKTEQLPTGDEDVTGNEQVPPAAAPIRAAQDVVTGAGLLPVWRNWVRLCRLPRVTQEIQILLWAEWITAGQRDALSEHAQAIIEAGTYDLPYPALKSRMTRPSGPAPLEPLPVARLSFAAGQRVRYPDGTEAIVLAVLSRGIATDHPFMPDVPLGMLKSLEVLA